LAVDNPIAGRSVDDTAMRRRWHGGGANSRRQTQEEAEAAVNLVVLVAQ
jgi:hypothetical protein